jgi:hypothetical protein
MYMVSARPRFEPRSLQYCCDESQMYLVYLQDSLILFQNLDIGHTYTLLVVVFIWLNHNIVMIVYWNVSHIGILYDIAVLCTYRQVEFEIFLIQFLSVKI